MMALRMARTDSSDLHASTAVSISLSLALSAPRNSSKHAVLVQLLQKFIGVEQRLSVLNGRLFEALAQLLARIAGRQFKGIG